MPSGTPKYFKQIESYSDRITPDDPEFEAKMRQLVGRRYQNLINKDAAGNVALPTDKYTLQGFNTGDTTSSEIPERYKQLEGLPTLLDKGKHVFGVGAGASPAVFAHEFRHDEVGDEVNNRLEDLLNSPSYPRYIHSLTSLYAKIGENKDIRERAYSAIGDDISPATLPLRTMEEELLPRIKEKIEYTRGGFNAHNNASEKIDNHIAINRGEYAPGLLDKGLNKVGLKDIVEGYGPHQQAVPKSLIEERDHYPGLHFIGTVSDGDKSSKELAYEARIQAIVDKIKTGLEAVEAAEAKNKKASGGTIELPNDYRPGGRTRMI